MPSLTSKTWSRRIAKARAAGKVRKRKNRRGTTPPFPIHLEGKPAATPPAARKSAKPATTEG
jgi:DNA-directed RNA polymerase specialized sigma24 family protein